MDMRALTQRSSERIVTISICGFEADPQKVSLGISLVPELRVSGRSADIDGLFGHIQLVSLLPDKSPPVCTFWCTICLCGGYFGSYIISLHAFGIKKFMCRSKF